MAVSYIAKRPILYILQDLIIAYISSNDFAFSSSVSFSKTFCANSFKVLGLIRL